MTSTITKTLSYFRFVRSRLANLPNYVKKNPLIQVTGLSTNVNTFYLDKRFFFLTRYIISLPYYRCHQNVTGFSSVRSFVPKTNLNVVRVQSSHSSTSLSASRLQDPLTYSLPPSSTKQYIQTKLPKNQRIIAIGDIHGDLQALHNFLNTAQIIHPSSTYSNPIWSGENTIVIQCGDIVDRGDDDLICLATMASLARQAKDHGGQIQLLHGNHESLNIVGVFEYANHKANQQFDTFLGQYMDNTMNSKNLKTCNTTMNWRLPYVGNQPARWKAFEPGGLLAKQMMANINVAVVIGKTVFVHAGLMKQHLQSYGGGSHGIVCMNLAARNWVLQEQNHTKKFFDTTEGKKTTIDEFVQYVQNRVISVSQSMPECLGGVFGSGLVPSSFTGAQSPLWMRNYSSPANIKPQNIKQTQEMIEECLIELGLDVERMVMGHTPQRKINGALNGKAWRIDVGASKGVMNGRAEVLEIIHCGAKNGRDDIVNILTMDGIKIPSSQRLV